jgi:hypothetical protein
LSGCDWPNGVEYSHREVAIGRKVSNIPIEGLWLVGAQMLESSVNDANDVLEELRYELEEQE